MNELQRKLLRKNRMSIVSDLEPKGKVLDTLYEDGVLTENDLELVSSANTRKERCHKLLSLLPTRGPSAYGSFQRALYSGKYDSLAYQLNPGKNNQESSNQRYIVRTKKCNHCLMFLKKLQSQGKYLNVLLNRIVTYHCCLLLDNIEPRDVVDQLFQDHVITADDIDRIEARLTRRDRCETLFEILLATRIHGNEVVESLKLALLKKYAYIIEHITNDFDDIQLLRKVCDTSQTQEGTIEQTFTSDHEDLLKPRLIEPTMQYSDGYIEGSDGTHKIHAIRKTNNSTSASTREQQERSASTLTSFHDPDQNSGTDLEASVKCPVKISTANVTVLSHFDTIIYAKCSNDTINCSSDEYVDMSLKHRTGISDRNDFIGKEAMKSLVDTRTVKSTDKEISDVKAENGNLHNIKRSQTNKTTRNSVQNLTDSTAEVNADQTRDRFSSKRAQIPKLITAFHSERPSRRLTVAFNYLSTLINQGDFDKFEETCLKLQNRFSSKYDLICIIGYLKTSKDLFHTDFDAAKSNIDSTLALVSKTNNPRYFTLEIFNAKTRMYITQKKLKKLQTTLDEAMMIFETDPVGCTGRAAGWLCVNDARNKTAQLSCLNLNNPNALIVYERLFEHARRSFQRSMMQFKCDGGKDGPFGFGYALCRLVILLLRCGDNGLTMNSLTPLTDDIQTAGQHLQHLKDSDIMISKILDMQFRMANCDYQFRRGNYVQALEHAQIAYDLATEMRLLEFTEHAYNRVSFLKPKLCAYFVANELSEEETQRILFQDSSDSYHNSESE